MLRQEFSLTILLDIAQLPRATFYYHLKRMKRVDKYETAKQEITAIYHENKGRYGYRRITDVLHSRGFAVNHKTVQRLMKELGLICRVRIKKYRSYKGEVGKVAPNLLNRDFHADRPNQKWVTDVTEFSLFGEKLYLSPILDLYSSDLVSYTISEHPVLSMVTTMLDKAFEKIPDGTTLVILFETEKGSLHMEVRAPDGSLLYEGSGRETTDFTVNISESGSYTVAVEARGAKGTIHIQTKEKEQ